MKNCAAGDSLAKKMWSFRDLEGEEVEPKVSRNAKRLGAAKVQEDNLLKLKWSKKRFITNSWQNLMKKRL